MAGRSFFCDRGRSFFFGRCARLICCAFLVVLLSGCTGYYGLPMGTRIPLMTPNPEDLLPSAGEEEQGGIVTFGISQYDTLNPLFTNSEDVKQIMWLVYDSLVSLDYAQIPQSALAVDWQTPDQGLTWDVTLREGVVWHDGSLFQAADVKSTADRILSEGGLYAANLQDVSSCTVLEEKAVRFTLLKRDISFPGKLAFPILPQSSYASVGQVPVGTGRYRYAGTGSDRLSFQRNPSFWGDSPFLDGFELISFANEQEKCRSDADVLLMYGEHGVKYGRKPGYQVYKYAGRSFTYLLPNLGEGGLSLTMRHVLRSCLDQNALVNYTVAGNGIASDWPALPETYYWGEAASHASADEQAAAELLSQAGYVRSGEDKLWYPVGDTGLKNPLTLSCIAPADSRELCTAAKAVGEQLKKAGILLDIIVVPAEEWSETLLNGSYHFAVMQLTLGNWPELEAIFTAEGRYNWNGYANAELNGCFSRAAQGADLDERAAALLDARRILNQDLPLIGLYLRQEMLVVRSSILGTGRQSMYCWNPLAAFSSWYLYTKA